MTVRAIGKKQCWLVFACATATLVLGALYSEDRGLIVDVDSEGRKTYATSLKSSGANDTLNIRLGLLLFGVSAAVAALAIRKSGARRFVLPVHAATVGVLLIDALLVGLDVSVVVSIAMGDHLLPGVDVTNGRFVFRDGERT